MALNFGGLGLAFVAKDEGASKTIQAIGSKIEWMSSTAVKMGSSLKSIGPKVAGMAGKMAGAFGSMADKAMSPDLDSAFSSQYAAFAKSWGEITVGMRISAKEAKRWKSAIGGAAIALNTDMSSLAQAWAAFRKQGVDLQKVLGTKGVSATVKRLAKMMSVLGIQGEQLATVAATLIKRWGFNEAGVKRLTDAVFAMGRHFNMGKEAMAALPGIMDTLGTELASMLHDASPKEIQALTLSIVKLGGGLQKALGVPAEQALELAKGMFQKVIGQRKDLEKMYIGMEGDVSELQKMMAMAGANIGDVFATMQKDPAAFMEALYKLGQAAKKHGGKMSVVYGRLLKVVDDTFGPDAAKAMKNWGKAQGSVESSTAALAKSNNALAKAVEKAFKTGRTAGDSYNLMLDGFRARIKGLTNQYIGPFMKSQREGFQRSYEIAKKYASDKGPLGELVRRLLLVQRVGFGGLFVKMGWIGPLLGNVAQQLVPLASGLSMLGVRLDNIGMFMKPGGLILGGLMLFNKKFRDQVIGVVSDFLGWVKKKAPSVIKELGRQFMALVGDLKDGFLWLIDQMPAVGEAVWEGLQTGFEYATKGGRWLLDVVVDGAKYLYKNAGAIGKVVARGLSKAWDWAVTGTVWLFDSARKLLSGFSGAVSKVDWSRVGQSITSGLYKAVGGAVAAVGGMLAKSGQLASSAGELVRAYYKMAGRYFVSMISMLYGMAAGLLDRMPDIFKGFYGLLKKGISALAMFGGWLLKQIWSGLKFVVSKIPEYAPVVGKALVRLFFAAWNAVKVALASSLNFVGWLLKSIGSWLASVDWAGVGKKIIGYIGAAIKAAGPLLLAAVAGLASLLWRAVKGLWEQLVGVITGRSMLGKAVRKIASGLWTLFKGILGAVWGMLKGGVSAIFSWLFGQIRSAFSSISGMISDAAGVAYKLISWIGDSFTSLGKLVWNALSGIADAFSFIKTPVKGFWAILQWIGGKIAKFFSWVSKQVKRAIGAIQGAYDDLKLLLGMTKPAVSKGKLTAEVMSKQGAAVAKDYWTQVFRSAITESDWKRVLDQYYSRKKNIEAKIVALQSRGEGKRTHWIVGYVKGMEKAMATAKKQRIQVEKLNQAVMPERAESEAQWDRAGGKRRAVSMFPDVEKIRKRSKVPTAPGMAVPAMTAKPEPQPVVKMAEKDRGALMDLASEVNGLKDAIRELSKRPVVVEITGDLRRLFKTVRKGSKAMAADALGRAGV